jgi:hypothetical protein
MDIDFNINNNNQQTSTAAVNELHLYLYDKEHAEHTSQKVNLDVLFDINNSEITNTDTLKQLFLSTNISLQMELMKSLNEAISLSGGQYKSHLLIYLLEYYYYVRLIVGHPKIFELSPFLIDYIAIQFNFIKNIASNIYIHIHVNDINYLQEQQETPTKISIYLELLEILKDRMLCTVLTDN